MLSRSLKPTSSQSGGEVSRLIGPRELAARALCRLHGIPEDATFLGKPIWMDYLKEVDVVLNAALKWKRSQPDNNT
jgi:hypothetical protein